LQVFAGCRLVTFCDRSGRIDRGPFKPALIADE